MTGMLTLSMEQALGLWSDFLDAEYGKHGFGGHTAEIYLYRLMPMSPILTTKIFADDSSIKATEKADACRRAMLALVELAQHYEEVRQAEVYVGDRRIGPWCAEIGETWRVHVRVVKPSAKDVP